MKLIFSLIFLMPFTTFGVELLAQNQPVDTINFIENLTRRNDSLVHNPNRIRPSDSLVFPWNRSRLSRELINLLAHFYATPANRAKKPATNANLAVYDGLIIKSITYKRVNIFASSVMDTGFEPETWLQKAGTSIHFSTRQKIIESNLIFHEGDRLDIFLASENERLIRELPYIMDARFLASPVPGSIDSVDLVLLTKDLLPVGFNLELANADAGNLGIGYYNLFGYGHKFKTDLYWDGRHSPFLGYSVLYGIQNIAGTFISSELEYIHRWNAEITRLNVSRDFKTVGIKYAGAIQFENAELIRDIVLPDSTLPDINWEYTNYDLWLGRLFILSHYHKAGRIPGLYVAGRLYNNNNRNTPSTSEHTFYNFQDKTQLLFSLGYTLRGFKKDNQIYTFDRTEDVPYGYMTGITYGVERGQFTTRPYMSFNASFGHYLRNKAYLNGAIGYGTFINGQSLEQSTLYAQLKSFSKLRSLGRFQLRNFYSFSYVNGINRNPDEFTRLENTGGIQGLTGPPLRGNEKIVLNLESVLFSPYRWLGFRIAFFGSLDLGFIKTENLRLYEADAYTGLGLGIRIRNENLVFETLEIKFSVYPGHPSGTEASHVHIGTIPRLRSNALFPDKPGVIEYN